MDYYWEAPSYSGRFGLIFTSTGVQRHNKNIFYSLLIQVYIRLLTLLVHGQQMYAVHAFKTCSLFSLKYHAFFMWVNATIFLTLYSAWCGFFTYYSTVVIKKKDNIWHKPGICALVAVVCLPEGFDKWRWVESAAHLANCADNELTSIPEQLGKMVLEMLIKFCVRTDTVRDRVRYLISYCDVTVSDVATAVRQAVRSEADKKNSCIQDSAAETQWIEGNS